MNSEKSARPLAEVALCVIHLPPWFQSEDESTMGSCAKMCSFASIGARLAMASATSEIGPTFRRGLSGKKLAPRPGKIVFIIAEAASAFIVGENM
eukprot:CAMPEP_0180505666 /NCGR_PEP_ID=MMETSP1036_2-20121128/47507_1 /TAXON_ID=632150 /ORGANISM="Azadinium spinosum, Strain 3D9" /LENGTH=94 /DNA_ID=CAMNT_0022515415 /DNA_START=124 /DNA_END=408 /DNA_ORIENTATION=-